MKTSSQLVRFFIYRQDTDKLYTIAVNRQRLHAKCFQIDKIAMKSVGGKAHSVLYECI